MLNKLRVLKALKGNAKRQTRILLGLKPRPKNPFLDRPIAEIIGAQVLICRRLVELWPVGLNLDGESACEIGPGDGLASAAFFIAKGASHVDLVELHPPTAHIRHLEVLKSLQGQGFPLALEVMAAGAVPAFNDNLVSYHQQHMETYAIENRHGFMFSHYVMEHVEDLESCFRAMYHSLRPGGQMLHIIDLGGHGEFEDPLPPLDFQTYPDWLFNWMYPINCRNTRLFLEDYRQAVTRAGFTKCEIRPLRVADKTYAGAIQSQSRPAARRQPLEDFAVVEFALTAVK